MDPTQRKSRGQHVTELLHLEIQCVEQKDLEDRKRREIETLSYFPSPA